MYEARLLPQARVMVLPACLLQWGRSTLFPCLKSGEIQCYSMAGKGPGEQEELQPCRKRLWPVSMPLGGLTKSWGAGEQWPSSCGTDGGDPKAPFCCAAQLGDGAQPVPVEQVCYQSHRPRLGQCCPCSQLRSLGLPAAGQCFAAASTQKNLRTGVAALFGIATKSRAAVAREAAGNPARAKHTPQREREGAPRSSCPVAFTEQLGRYWTIQAELDCQEAADRMPTPRSISCQPL